MGFDTPKVLAARNVDVLVADRIQVRSYTPHGPFGQDERFVHQLESVGVKARDGGAALTFEAQVLGDQGPVGQRQEPVVAAVDRQPPFGQHREVVGVQSGR